MRKYNVSLSLRPLIPILYEIEADSPEQAEDRAVELALQVKIVAPSGDRVELTGDDVIVDYAEESDA